MKWSDKSRVKQGLLLIMSAVLTAGVVAPAVMAASRESFFTRNNILFLDTDGSLSSSGESEGCSNLLVSQSVGAAAEVGLSKELMEIKDPKRFAKAIDDWIIKKAPKSPLKGLGRYAVMGGQRSGINPMLAIGIALKESTLGTNVAGAGRKLTEGYNAYGRTATNSQPHIETGRKWYKWNSFADSLFDKTSRKDDMYAYISRVYKQHKNFDKFMNAYAPPSENDTEKYIQEMKQWASEIYELAGDSIDITKLGKKIAYDDCQSPDGYTGGEAGAVSLDGFTMFYQKTGPWAKQLIGKGGCLNRDFAWCGCGPTSLAIVVANLTGDKNITPPKTRDLSLFADVGISWTALDDVPRKFGLKTQRIGLNVSKVRETLQKGGYVMVSQGSGPLTPSSDGHIFVIRGMTSDGRFLVADPDSPKHTNNKKGYSIRDITVGTRNMWAVTK